MPSGPSAITRAGELDKNYPELYWRFVVACLHRVFKLSDVEAQESVKRMRTKAAELSDEATLYLYHDSPLQIASVLAGAARRPLTEEELLAYDKLWGESTADRPTREQILKVHTQSPKAG
jgi:hypothetical protein